jgi:hypothetical protein
MSEQDDELTEERMQNLESQIKETTIVTLTPDGEEHGFPEGSMWLYSQGMWDNYGLPDLEMRGVPTSFANAAGQVINEMNAYRLHQMNKNPFLPGQTVQWNTGHFKIHQGEDWDGRFEWKAEQMLRLLPNEVQINCACCEMREAGMDEA